MKNQKQYSKKFSGCILAAAISLTGVATAQADWLQGGMGSVPANAIVGGNEANGQALYICRANYAGGFHPGKLRKEFAGCNIPWGGREISVPIYQVAANSARTNWHWVNSFTGIIPNGAVVGGNEPNGETLYLCRGKLNGGMHPEKSGPDLVAVMFLLAGKK